MLAKRKLEYTDFSAGITENIVPGKMNAYARADNKLITRDKQLETRPGSRIYGDNLYQLPTGRQRVGSFFPFHNETTLFAQSGKELFYATTSWQQLSGPFGNSAFLNNTAQSQVNSAESRRRTVYVSDSGDGPQMVYPDSSGVFQLRQAGLPKPVVSAPYTDTSLLVAAVALATATCQAMAAHAGSTAAHLSAHASMVTALNALNAPSTLADLITYIGVLKTQYNAHIADAQLSGAAQTYHIKTNTIADPSGTHFLGRYAVLNTLAVAAAPTDLASCVISINEIRNLYNFHTYATITHLNAVVAAQAPSMGYSTSTSGFGLNAVAVAPIDTRAFTVSGFTSYFPVFTGQYSPLFSYVNQVKKEFNAHLASAGTSTGAHNVADTDNTIVISDATDVFSAWVVLAHLEFAYWWHYKDAGQDEFGASLIWNPITGTATAGSNTLTSSSDGASFVGYYGLNIVGASPFAALWNHYAPGVFVSVPVTVTGDGGTASHMVFSQNLNVTGTDTFMITTSKFHFYGDAAPGAKTTPTDYLTRTNAYDYSLTDDGLTKMVAAAEYLKTLVKSHQLSALSPTVIGDNTYYFKGAADTVTTTTPHNPGISGTLWPVASVIIDGSTRIPTDATIYLDSPPSTATQLYTLVWRFNYNVFQLQFQDESTPAQSSQIFSALATVAVAPAHTAVTLTGLPVLVNAPGQNWDTANINLDIYRTESDQKTFFKVGSVSNGTTTFVDSVADIDLPSGEEIYTTGGVVANDQPPPARYITVVNSTAYYGYVTDITSGDVFPNRVIQAIPGTLAAVPATFFDDLDDEISGLTHFNSNVIALCLTSLYRLEGTYNELGQGGITHQEISHTIGCISGKSVASTEEGVFFAGTNGIYWTDGFTAHRVSKELDRTYASYTATPQQRTAISSAYDKLTRRVYWKFKSNPTTAECDLIWVLDLNWGVSDTMSFTTMSGGAGFTPTALGYYQGQLLRGDALGYVFKYDSSYKSDPLIDPDTAATDWLEQPILWDFESCATNFGSSQIKKWATRITVQGKNRSNLSLQISHKNDNGKTGYHQLVPIRVRNNVRWGDYRLKWGDSSCVWKYDGMIDEFRRFNAGTLRCDWKSIRMQNAYVIVATSDDANSAGYAAGDGD